MPKKLISDNRLPLPAIAKPRTGLLLSRAHLPSAHRRPTWVVLLPQHCHRCPQILGHVQGAAIRMVSVAAPDFVAAAWGFAPASLREALHIRDLAGQWHTGIDAELLLRALIAQADVNKTIA